jgi:hypothetical protein
MRLDLPEQAVELGRAGAAALPTQKKGSVSPAPEERSVPAIGRRPTLACDVCGSARTRDERRRLVWEGDLATSLVLAELCRHCAASADPLLELYGGRGSAAIRLVQEIRVSASARSVQRRAFSYTARGILYLLVAVASFLLVTLVTSRGR